MAFVWAARGVLMSACMCYVLSVQNAALLLSKNYSLCKNDDVKANEIEQRQYIIISIK